jgi:hypothetical protein
MCGNASPVSLPRRSEIDGSAPVPCSSVVFEEIQSYSRSFQTQPNNPFVGFPTPQPSSWTFFFAYLVSQKKPQNSIHCTSMALSSIALLSMAVAAIIHFCK